jgi:hypothetical protein
MSNLNEKRVKTLLKGNAIVDKAIELMKTETANKSCTIRSFHKTAKHMVEVKTLLSSVKFKNEMKKAEIKGMDNIKVLVPIVLGISYSKFARELQVAKVTITQLEAFIKAVKGDEDISVSKQGLLSFVKGKKRAKTKTAEPTPKADVESGEEESKDGGEESTPKSNVVGVFELKGKGVKVELLEDENGRRVELNGASLKDVAKAFKLFQTQIEMLTEVRVKK